MTIRSSLVSHLTYNRHAQLYHLTLNYIEKTWSKILSSKANYLNPDDLDHLSCN